MNERPIRARKQYDTHHNIIAVYQDRVFVERTGEIAERRWLPWLTRHEKSSIIIGERMTLVLKELDDHFKAFPNWQYKIKTVIRELYSPNQSDITRSVKKTVVCFFGFRDQHRHNNYHHALDPTIFSRLPIQALIDDDYRIHLQMSGGFSTQSEPSGFKLCSVRDDPLLKLFAWGKSIRDFCQQEGLRPSPSAGGLAAQLLRDSRFWSLPRRKIPKATNAKARSHLPGNHYQLRHNTGSKVNATYIDMENAHHVCAKDINFPDCNSLYGSGAFRTLDAWRSSPQSSSLLNEYGLLYVTIRGHTPRGFCPPYLSDLSPIKSSQIFIYSNEIPFLESFGARITEVIAAWTSPEKDLGLNKYAEWALETLRANTAQDRRWLKPMLLTTYGVLGTKARTMEFGFNVAKNREREMFPIERGTLEAYACRTKRPRESSITNVIARGMIEAECRKRVIELARELSLYGVRVLGLYADSLFVDSSHPLPFLPPPWRVKAYLTDLEFFNPTSFQSVEMTRLPGIPREARERLARTNSFKSLMANPPDMKYANTP